MQILFAFILHVFHFLYSVALKARSFWKQRSPTHPRPLTAHRHRIPKHLAIVFVTDPNVSASTAQSILTESVLDVAKWCRTIGIKKLTVYEKMDLLSQCTRNIRDSLPVKSSGNDTSESETEYPLTPPPSDYSESRPLSPDHSQASIVPVTVIHVADPLPAKEVHKRRKSAGGEILDVDTLKNDLVLSLVSPRSSKPAIAAAARALAQTKSRRPRRNGRSNTSQPFTLSVDQLNQLLEDEDRLSSPDFLIIHHIASSSQPSTPPELHGFPPWHIRLTEIYHNMPHFDRPRTGNWRSSYESLALDENSFREALDEFASAEMRFGK